MRGGAEALLVLQVITEASSMEEQRCEVLSTVSSHAMTVLGGPSGDTCM
jgi:hypothetical protein